MLLGIPRSRQLDTDAKNVKTILIAETPRLLLRPLRPEDADDLLLIFRDPVAMRYYPGLLDRRQTEDWIAWNLELYSRRGFGLWGAVLKDPRLGPVGSLVGQVGLVEQVIDGDEAVELGYLFQRRFWGRGLASEAAIACRDLAFGRFVLPRLVALIDPRNRASRRVAEKAGLHLDRRIERDGRALDVLALERRATARWGPGRRLPSPAAAPPRSGLGRAWL